MIALASGARRLPSHHTTIRVPWHDGGCTGAVCAHPQANTSCLILPRIGEGKHDEVEMRCAGKRLDELAAKDLPPCVWQRVIAEKRATFSCTVGLKRPPQATPLRNFFLAGDYTASDYPATLEAAVRSGIRCAELVAGSRAPRRA